MDADNETCMDAVLMLMELVWMVVLMLMELVQTPISVFELRSMDVGIY